MKFEICLKYLENDIYPKSKILDTTVQILENEVT